MREAMQDYYRGRLGLNAQRETIRMPFVEPRTIDSLATELATENEETRKLS